jgi:hypothetical protein
MPAAELESTGTTDEALIQAFQEPVRVFLRDRTIIHSLLDALAHFSGPRLLDRRPNVLDSYAGFFRQLFQSAATPQGIDQLIGRHAERFRSGLQTCAAT